ncbi:MAG: hypothetical protein K6G42_05770 [Lachnospiraceae bacterium]|nr:hypothetical protein [Lachnospiraceae bacterium]
MKALKISLIALLSAIILLCAIIALSAVRPDLFRGFKKAGTTSEDATAVQPDPSVQEPLPEEPSETVSPDTVSSDAVSSDSVSQNIPDGSEDYFAEDVPGSGLKNGLSPSYVAEDSELDVPSGLSSKTGLTEPHGTYDILDDDKADELEADLSTGPTGDDLDFDEEFYPYYHMLDDKGKHLYRQIYANALELNPDFRAVEKDMPWSSFRNVFEAVFNDHPELFWLNTQYSAGYRNNGDCLEIVLSFNRTAKDLEGSAAEFDEGANKILNTTQGDIYDQEKAAHDSILDNFSYNLSAEMNQSAYSGFANNSTVCAGYARCFQYIMQTLGVPCYYCRGYAGEPHAWNIIKLDGDYYNVDATWDDSDQTWKYEYFNVSDDDIAGDHRRTSLSVYLPPCNGGKYSGLETKPADDENGNGTGSGANNDSEGNGRDKDNRSSELPDGTYVDNADDYFEKCLNAIKDAGKGTYSFDLYTTDKEVYNTCMSAYANGSAKSRFMNEAFESVEGAKGMSVDFIGSEGDGVYKMTQNVKLW